MVADLGGLGAPEARKQTRAGLRRILARDARGQYGCRIHAGHRPAAGGAAARRCRNAAGEHGRPWRLAERSADGRHVGGIPDARGRPRSRDRAAMVRRPHRRRHRALRRAGRQVGAQRHQPAHALRIRDPSRRDGAARAERADLSQCRARAHAARLDASERCPRGAGGTARAAEARRREPGCRAAALVQEPGDRGGDLGSGPQGFHGAGGAFRSARDSGDQRPGQTPMPIFRPITRSIWAWATTRRSRIPTSSCS